MPINLRDTSAPPTNQDNKHLKAFAGVVLFVIFGFALAALYPVAHPDSPDNQAPAFVRPAN